MNGFGVVSSGSNELRKKNHWSRPVVHVTKSIKSIFSDKKHIIHKEFFKKSKNSQSKTDLIHAIKSSEFEPSFEQSEILDTDSTKKLSVSKQSNFLDEKLCNLMKAINKKPSFEETTIVISPSLKKNEQDFGEEIEFMKFLKESVNTDANLHHRRRKIDRHKIQYDSKVFDIFDPEFSSEDEKAQQNSNLAKKTVMQNFQNMKYSDEKREPHQVRSVYYDNQDLIKADDKKNEEIFEIYSTKLIPLNSSVSNSRKSKKNKNLNFFKKVSIYDHLVEQSPFVSPLIRPGSSLKKKKTLSNCPTTFSKLSIDKIFKRPTEISRKKTETLLRIGNQESFSTALKTDLKTQKKIHELIKKSENSSSAMSQRFFKSKPLDGAPLYSKYLLGGKKGTTLFLNQF